MNSHPIARLPEQDSASAPGLLILGHKEIAELLDLDSCIVSVEEAFRAHGNGQVMPAGLLHVDAANGGFHIKTGGLTFPTAYFGLKANARFAGNREKYGLPNVQGLIYLADGDCGAPLAIMDSIHITGLRTAAATAVAARFLAPSGPAVVTVCGCGTQARIQLAAISRVRTVVQAYAHSRSDDNMRAFSLQMSDELGIPVEPSPRLAQATLKSNIILTCTPSRRFYLCAADVRPGTFIAAIGSDSAGKQELEPQLLAHAKVVVDILDQAAHVGELHYALEQGLMQRSDVYAELGQIVAGHKPGRLSEDETIVFDSTGTAMQDVAAASAVYVRAMKSSCGVRVPLQEP
jgi:alanine dehydrogenase